ncbi:trace amine-associated receptor 1-like [Chanos chanos]|uniref:Trace amine-associated receptor 1-like n=1 Tax=Chanos chanos TaxID=29144 RepID=A0A6J2W3F3_CHACN|nr:trace amine-associated receptor 1-like [Chanos chanos]
MDLSQLNTLRKVSFCFETLNNSCVKTIYAPAIRTPLYIFCALTIILIVCGNLLVICCIASFQRLHTPTNYLILSLAVSDLLLGAFVMPPGLVRSLETCWYFGDFFCMFHSSADFSLCNASILHLTFISIDRYYAVCKPLEYQTKFNNWVSLAMIAMSWTLSIVFGFAITFSDLRIEGKKDLHVNCKGSCLAMHGREIGVGYSIIFYFIPVTIIISIYTKIFFIAQKHAKVIHSITLKVNINKMAAGKLDMKATKTLAVVIGVFLSCWTPFFMCNITDPLVGHSIPPLLYEILMWLAYLNSMFNPVIYALSYSWFRDASKTLWNKLFNQI